MSCCSFDPRSLYLWILWDSKPLDLDALNVNRQLIRSLFRYFRIVCQICLIISVKISLSHSIDDKMASIEQFRRLDARIFALTTAMIANE